MVRRRLRLSDDDAGDDDSFDSPEEEMEEEEESAEEMSMSITSACSLLLRITSTALRTLVPPRLLYFMSTTL
jgi:hypothetical protein